MSESENRRTSLDALRRLSDEELAREAADGDDGAASVLLERFEEPLHRYTVALVRDPDLAREATWSALFEAARAVRANEYAEPLAPWLFRIAHTAADVAGGRPEVDRAGTDFGAPLTGAAGASEYERLQDLLGSVDALPNGERSALLLRELVGLEYAGIATVMGIRPAAARQSVFRARLALQGNVPPLTEHCDEIRAAMSKAESGIRDRRSIALHLDTCPVCSDFAEGLERRADDLRAVFPPPSEPLVAELLPPLPPPPAAPRRASPDRGPERRRRGALVPILLALLLAGAAVATARALNDSGGDDNGRASAGTQASVPAKPERSEKPEKSDESKEAKKDKKGAAGAGGAGGSGSGDDSGSDSKAGAAGSGSGSDASGSDGSAGGGSGSNPGDSDSGGSGSGGSGPDSDTDSDSGSGSGTDSGSGSGDSGSDGSGAESGSGGSDGSTTTRETDCPEGPGASPAQSGYSGSAGAAQTSVVRCVESSRAGAGGGLANTGIDLMAFVAAGLWLLALGVGLRMLAATKS